jgi:DNA replication protein DnaC
MPHLLSGRWLDEHRNCLITGPTAVGKTWLACALAQQACRQGYTARYLPLPRLLPDLALARADGRYPRLLREYAKTQLLIMDDWGLAPLAPEGRRDLLEILDDRHHRHSTVVTSQLPVAAWHEYLHKPTLVEAWRPRRIAGLIKG